MTTPPDFASIGLQRFSDLRAIEGAVFSKDGMLKTVKLQFNELSATISDTRYANEYRPLLISLKVAAAVLSRNKVKKTSTEREHFVVAAHKLHDKGSKRITLRINIIFLTKKNKTIDRVITISMPESEDWSSVFSLFAS